ncbi:Zinc finger protein Xfin [Trichinella britovi]|uniref:Zinc finger protein Xfin n=1 Tax=Trichinella britovi TaxID=45882 RepID=A0A0V1D062_TRIBR|nr:Zinc finger protein Xfin [Trichinella britovi]
MMAAEIGGADSLQNGDLLSAENLNHFQSNDAILVNDVDVANAPVIDSSFSMENLVSSAVTDNNNIGDNPASVISLPTESIGLNCTPDDLDFFLDSVYPPAPIVSMFSCSICSENFSTEESLISHRDFCTPEALFVCNNCNLALRDEQTYLDHVEICPSSTLYKCYQCNKCFVIKRNLRLHMALHSKQELKKCPICEMTFRWKAPFQCHLKLHEVEEKFRCAFCQLELSTQEELFAHVSQAHPSNSVPSAFSCEHCSAVFETQPELMEHRNLHQTMRQDLSSKSLPTTQKRVKKAADNGVQSEKRKYQCDICKKFYSSKSALDRHTFIHTGEKRFSCGQCGKKFIQQPSLTSHENGHLQKKPHECKICGSRFTQKGNLCTHIRRLHPLNTNGNYFQCSTCPCFFKNWQTLNRHVTQRHSAVVEDNSNEYQPNGALLLQSTTNNSSQPAGATDAAAAAADAAAILTTENENCIPTFNANGNSVDQSDNSSNFLTDVCFGQSSSLVENNALQPKRVEYSADMNATLLLIPLLNSQTILLQETGPEEEVDGRKWKCHFCEKRFKRKYDRMRHIRVHTGERPYKCDCCQSAFKLKSTLKRHVRSVHSGIKEKRCYICFKALSSASSLKVHLRLHFNEGFDCTRCNRRFTTTSRLKQHNAKYPDCAAKLKSAPAVGNSPANGTAKRAKLPTHLQPLHVAPDGTVSQLTQPGCAEDPPPTEPDPDQNDPLARPHPCGQCNKRFKKASHLRNHRRTHVNERPYKCYLCERGFRTPSALKDHAQFHAGKRRYVCSICRRGFMSRRCLTRHRFVHSDQCPFVCPICYKRFKRGVVCREHIRRHLRDGEVKNETVPAVEQQQQQQQQQQQTGAVSWNSGCFPVVEIPADSRAPCATDSGDGPTNTGLQSPKYFCDISHSVVAATPASFDSAGADLNTNVDFLYALDERRCCGSVDFAANAGSLQSTSTATLPFDNNDDTVYVCHLCPETFGRRELLEEHSGVCHHQSVDETSNCYDPREHLFRCFLCAEVSNDLDSFSNHIHLKHRLNLCTSCAPCRREFLSALELSLHIANHHAARYWQFDSPSHSDQLFLQDNLPSIPWFGDAAGVNWNNSTADNYSETVVKNDAPRPQVQQVQVPVVSGAQVRNLPQLTVVASNIILTPVAKLPSLPGKHVCQYCSRPFKKRCDLVRHIRTHTGEKPFQCDICKRSFSASGTLRNHLRVHEPKSFPCVDCGAQFSSKAQLEIHRIVHRAIYPSKKNHFSTVRQSNGDGSVNLPVDGSSIQNKVYNDGSKLMSVWRCGHSNLSGLDNFPTEYDEKTVSQLPLHPPLPAQVPQQINYSHSEATEFFQNHHHNHHYHQVTSMQHAETPADDGCMMQSRFGGSFITTSEQTTSFFSQSLKTALDIEIIRVETRTVHDSHKHHF